MAIKKNITEAKAQFSSLVERAENGEEIIIGRAGRPVAKIVPFDNRKDFVRTPNIYKGTMVIGEDFDELPDDFMEYFGGK